MYSFTGQGVISQKPNDASKKKTLCLALDYCLSFTVARLVRFWFKSLQSLTTHIRQFLQGNLFLLAVCAHEVPLYLCSIFCSPSLVQVSTASCWVLSAEHDPNCAMLFMIDKLISGSSFEGKALLRSHKTPNSKALQFSAQNPHL